MWTTSFCCFFMCVTYMHVYMHIKCIHTHTRTHIYINKVWHTQLAGDRKAVGLNCPNPLMGLCSNAQKCWGPHWETDRALSENHVYSPTLEKQCENSLSLDSSHLICIHSKFDSISVWMLFLAWWLQNHIGNAESGCRYRYNMCKEYMIIKS